MRSVECGRRAREGEERKFLRDGKGFDLPAVAAGRLAGIVQHGVEVDGLAVVAAVIFVEALLQASFTFPTTLKNMSGSSCMRD